MQKHNLKLKCFKVIGYKHLKIELFFRYRDNIVIPNFMGPPKIKTNEEKMIESVVESCFFKSFMACVLGKRNILLWFIQFYVFTFANLMILFSGYGLGAAIGLFSSSVNPNVAAPGIEKQQTAREVFREMRTTTHGYAKNFALIGMVFSAVECTIETVK